MPQVVYGHEVSNTLATPFRLIVGGASGSGKTELVKKMIHEQYFGRLRDIHYCYPEYLSTIPAVFDVPVQYHSGLLSLSDIKDLEDGCLLIIDDLMLETAASESIAKLFTVCARKRGISVILLVQNIYQQGKHFRNIRLNASAIIMFKFRAGQDVNKRLLRDLGLQHMISADQLQSSLEEKYSFILFDLHPSRHSDFGCVRSNIFSENFRVFYTMEYVAIPKELFIEHFQIINQKNGKIKALKNEITIKPTKKDSKSDKRSKKRRTESSESDSKQSRSSRKPTSRKRKTAEPSEPSESESSTDYTDSD